MATHAVRRGEGRWTMEMRDWCHGEGQDILAKRRGGSVSNSLPLWRRKWNATTRGFVCVHGVAQGF
jgi:hypothetical protein